MTRNAHEIGVEMAMEYMDTFKNNDGFTYGNLKALLQGNIQRKFSDPTVIKEILEAAEGVFFARKDEFK